MTEQLVSALVVNDDERLVKTPGVHVYDARETGASGEDHTISIVMADEYKRYDKWLELMMSADINFAIGMYSLFRIAEQMLSAADGRQLARAAAYLAAELVNYEQAKVEAEAQDAAQGIQRTND